MPSGADNVLTIHTTDGTERFRIDSSGNVKVGSAATISPDGDLFVTGVCTATTLSGAASGLTGALPAISAANLTNIPAANVTGTLPAISGANLTNLTSGNLTGALPAVSAASLTQIPAANIVGVCTSGLTKTGGFGAILQAVSTTKTDVSSGSVGSGGYHNSGVSVSITPSNSSNKILIVGYVMTSVVGPQHNIGVVIKKDSSVITGYLGDADGSRRQNAAVGTNMVSSYENFTGQINFQYLDTAGGTSAITYEAAIRNPSSTTRTVYVNRATTDTDSNSHYRTASTITVMEVAA